MKFARLAAATLVTSLVLLALARLSAASVKTHGPQARMRLSWSARPERIETCRAVSEEELAEREEHMRQRVECAGRFATYFLRVRIDGRLVHESVVRGGGLRHDRPIFLLREVAVPAGARRLRVTFVRREKVNGRAAAFVESESDARDSGIFAGRAEREVTERARRARAAIPPKLELERDIVVRNGEVVVVTLDPERGALEILRPAR